jgi:hypothetical protein
MHQTITRGATREAAPLAEPAVTCPAPAAARPAAARRRPAESASSMAGVAVLLGVAGLFVFNVIFGPLAIGVGVAALRRHMAPARTRAAALAGVALGAADLIVLAVLVAVSLAHGGITWHFGA